MPLTVKKRIVLMGIILLLFANTALAANWTYLERLEGTRYGSCTEYFDSDSVVKNNGSIIYWTLWVVDDDCLQFHDTKKIVWKQEAILASPVKYRNIERYLYNAKGQETSRYLKLTDFHTVLQHSVQEEAMNRIALYAQDGRASEQIKPDNSKVATESWYGPIDFTDGQFYWDRSRVAGYTRDGQNQLEIIVKWVWTPEGINERKAALATRTIKQNPAEYEGLTYTVVNYQFLADINQVRRLSIADYNKGNQRLTFMGSDQWQEIVAGSKADEARKIIVNQQREKGEG